MRGLELDKGIYDSLKPLSETIAQSVDGLDAKSFLEERLMQAELAQPDGKMISHKLNVPKTSLRAHIDYLIRKNYDALTFHELKEQDAQKYYSIMFVLWHIKSSKEMRKIMPF